jgi:hypothetical protein
MHQRFDVLPVVSRAQPGNQTEQKRDQRRFPFAALVDALNIARAAS